MLINIEKELIAIRPRPPYGSYFEFRIDFTWIVTKIREEKAILAHRSIPQETQYAIVLTPLSPIKL
jgi:hypothetical protein